MEYFDVYLFIKASAWRYQAVCLYIFCFSASSIFHEGDTFSQIFEIWR